MSSPDPRFTFANERTFLAWVRTALGCVAAAAALTVVDVPWPAAVVSILSAVLALTGALCVALAWSRWRSAEEALAAGRGVSMGRQHLIVAAAVGAVALAVVVLSLTQGRIGA